VDLHDSRPPSGCEPITDDDATIARFLEDVSVPTLLMSLVHLSGDAAVLDDLPAPVGNYLNEVQGFMSDEDRATVRACALQLIAEYRD
jgi:4-hydroxyacetophenone monooxygenase